MNFVLEREADASLFLLPETFLREIIDNPYKTTILY